MFLLLSTNVSDENVFNTARAVNWIQPRGDVVKFRFKVSSGEQENAVFKKITLAASTTGYGYGCTAGKKRGKARS